MNKLILLVIAAMIGYYGYDGLQVNKDLVDYTVEEIEKNGIGNDRYIRISNGYTIGEFVYEYNNENSSQANEIIFPLVNETKLNSYINGNTEIGYVNILVKRNHDKFNRNCITEATCIDDVIEKQSTGTYSVKGVTLVGLDDVDDKTKDLLTTSGFKISPNVIFLEEDKEPKGNGLSILMLIGGILGVIIIIGSYFSGETNNEE